MIDLYERRRQMMENTITDPYVLQPFTLVVVKNCTLNLLETSTNVTELTSIKYKLNNQNWVTVTIQDIRNDDVGISLVVGDVLQLIGDGAWSPPGTTSGNSGFCLEVYNVARSTPYFNIEGNLMSLFAGDNFINQTVIPDSCFFEGLFYDGINSPVGDITNLRIPATTIEEAALMNFFYQANNLVGDIENLLPATTVEDYAYSEMFRECTKLTNSPKLPAEIIGESAYEAMFQNCTNLTTAGEILAKTLGNRSCRYMFYGCSSLTSTPEFGPTTLASNCCYGMFSGCSNLTTAFSKLPATTLQGSCYSNMFYNCSKLERAPELLATSLVSYCYQNMFRGCSSLNYIKAMHLTWSSTNYTQNWVRNVPGVSTGTFVKNVSATYTETRGASNIPSNWVIQTASS